MNLHTGAISGRGREIPPVVAGEGSGPHVGAETWHASLAGTVATVDAPEWLPWRVVRISDTPEELRQPALLDDVICLHGGGAKEVQRVRALRRTTHDVASGAVTVMPRGRAAQWRTRGPIAYSHVVLSPKALDVAIASEFDSARELVDLRDDVGVSDPLLGHLIAEMVIVATNAAEHMRLYREALFTAAALRLFHRCADGVKVAAPDRAVARGGLPGWRLRRVVDYFHEHRACDIGYEQLTEIAGLSRAQFFRAFKQSMGCSPGRYLERIRLDEAKRALERKATLEEAAVGGGFATVAAMSRPFRRIFGISPSDYRSWYR